MPLTTVKIHLGQGLKTRLGEIIALHQLDADIAQKLHFTASFYPFGQWGDI